jgi:dTDP-4-amino-4,6-dideoxygalactose transaminase
LGKNTGRKIAAILPVDALGHPADLDPILEMALKYNINVIEDATEALGAEYKGAKVASRAPISCLSFNGNKIITLNNGKSDFWKGGNFFYTHVENVCINAIILIDSEVCLYL